MDFPTRNLYRSAIEQLAPRLLGVRARHRGGVRCRRWRPRLPRRPSRRRSRPYYLIGNGRSAFERTIQFHPPRPGSPRPQHTARQRRGLYRYTPVTLVAAARSVSRWVASWALYLGRRPLQVGGSRTLFALAGFIPASEVATALVNRGVA